MASVYFLVPDVDLYLEKIQNASDELGDNSCIEFRSARTIQSYVRRFIIQRYIKKLNKSAIVIQKWYRGWRGRVLYRRMLEENVAEMYQRYYNKMASIIQKTWHGYLSRRDIFSYYALKAWIRKVQDKNEEVLATIKASEDELKKQRLEEFEIEASKWVVFILAKLHHLLRTKTIVGVYSKNYSTELTDFEKLLKSIQYKKYMGHLRKYYNKIVKTQKPPVNSGNYLPVIGHEDLYWYLSKEDIENMIEVGKELKGEKMQQNYVNHPKEFRTITKLSCKERKKKEWCVTSVFTGKYDEGPKPGIERGSRHDLDISTTKFYNYKNPVISRSTLNYIDYNVNVLLNKKCTILRSS